MADEKVNLRKTKPNRAEVNELPRHTVDLPGLKGDLPFMPGNIILTESEKRVLKEKFGWKEGDPVPNLSAVTKAKIADMKTAPAPPFPEGMKGILDSNSMPETIQFDDLDANKQKEIAEAIKRTPKVNPASDSPFIPRDPSISKAMSVAEQVEARTARKTQQVKVEDDRQQRKATVTRPTSKQQPEITPPEAVPEEKPAESPASADLTKTHCQHCGWDLSQSDEAKPTPEDYRVFVAATLSGKRFVKTYDLFDGAMQVTFRAMTVREYDTIKRQLFYDGSQGRVSTPAEVYRMATEYQLAICLESLYSNEGGAINMPTLDKYDLDDVDDDGKPTTGLPQILEYVYEKAVPTASLRNMLLALYAEFDNLIVKIEAESRKPGFSKAIGGSR